MPSFTINANKSNKYFMVNVKKTIFQKYKYLMRTFNWYLKCVLNTSMNLSIHQELVNVHFNFKAPGLPNTSLNRIRD